MEHTKEEWKIEKGEISKTIDGIRTDKIRLCSFRSFQPKPPEEEIEANANLITAAPDLLKVCENIKEIIDYIGEINNTDLAVIEELEQAIAKAKRK